MSTAADPRWQQVIPGLHRFQSQLPGQSRQANSYLLATAYGPLLIDPVGDVPTQLPAELAGQKIEHILVTHLQAEHVAGCGKFPDARVHVPAGDEYLAYGPEAYQRLDTTWLPPWEWDTRGNYRGHLGGARNERPSSAALTLGEPLRAGEATFGLQILASPGHGKSAVSLVTRIGDKRVGFCGDVVYGAGQMWNYFDCDWDYGLQGGARALAASAQRLAQAYVELLCPAHGPTLERPRRALRLLARRLDEIIDPIPPAGDGPPLAPSINIAAAPSGFRKLLPGLYQYVLDGGNCAALVADSGHALFIDDGLCFWKDLPQRAEHHRQVIQQFKQEAGICKVELVIPTHYHGDHVENIRELIAMEGCQVVSLDLVADVLEEPQRFNLACPLPWYGGSCQTTPVHQRVAGGTRWRWRGFELEIFHLAGQTYYHAGIAVSVAGKRVMFTGDSFPGGTQCEAVLSYNDNEPAGRGWLYAIDRMLERSPDLLVCGHTYAVADPVPLLRWKRQRWQEQLALYQELSAQPQLRAFFDPFI